MARQRLSTWLGSPAAAKSLPSSTAGGFGDAGLLLSALRSNAPGQWSQNLIELSRHFTSASFLAINTLCTQASGSKFKIYERDNDAPDGKRRLGFNDPLYQLFEDPNPGDSFADLLYQIVQQISLTGISLRWEPPTADGLEPREIYPIASATAWPLPPSTQYPQGAYRVTPYPYGTYSIPVGQVAAGAIIPAEQIKRIKNHHPFLRYDGYAVLTAISMHVDTLEAIDKSRFNTQQNGCEQSLVLNLDKESTNPNLDDLKKLRAQLQAVYAGPQNAGKMLIAPPGGEWDNIATTPAEMGWTEGWQQILDFILAAYGVPMAVAGLQSNLSYATLYSSLRAFSYLSLGPLLGRIEGGVNKHTIRPAYGRGVGLDIIPPEFKDEQLNENKISNDMKGGVRLVRELRRERGLDELDEKEYPWVKDRCWAQGQPSNMPEGGSENKPESSSGAADGGGREEDPAVNNARPSKTLTRNDRAEILANAFEKHKTNGHVKPIKE